MKQKRTIINRIRGWLPKTPALPKPQRKGPSSKHAKAVAKPDVTVISNRRIQLSKGIFLGFGIGLILVGLFGWLSVSRTYSTLEKFFVAGGLDLNYYLFRDLIDQMAFHLTLMSFGACLLLLVALTLKNQTARRIIYSYYPHSLMGVGLIGGGISLTLMSIHRLFKYILASSYRELQIFFIFFTVGAILIICGIFALIRKNKNGN